MFSLSFCVQMFCCGRSSLKLRLSKLDARPNVPVGSFGPFRERFRCLVANTCQSQDLGSFRVAGDPTGTSPLAVQNQLAPPGWVQLVPTKV